MAGLKLIRVCAFVETTALEDFDKFLASRIGLDRKVHPVVSKRFCILFEAQKKDRVKKSQIIRTQQKIMFAP